MKKILLVIGIIVIIGVVGFVWMKTSAPSPVSQTQTVNKPLTETQRVELLKTLSVPAEETVTASEREDLLKSLSAPVSAPKMSDEERVKLLESLQAK